MYDFRGLERAVVVCSVVTGAIIAGLFLQYFLI